MSRPIASEVRVSAHGVVAIGRGGLGTRVYFRARGVTRLELLTLRFEAPRGAPATLLPDGRLLVVGRRGECLLVTAGRSPQPGPPLSKVVVDGVSVDGVAFAPGPAFFRFAAGGWVDERLPGEARVNAVGDLAVGDGGAAWVYGPGWEPLSTKTKANLGCAAGAWAGGEGVVVERTAKGVVAYAVKGTVTSIAPWKKSALLVIDGRLVELGGAVLKAPGQLTSISSHGDALWCVANGSVFETSDLKRFRRQVLPG